MRRKGQVHQNDAEIECLRGRDHGINIDGREFTLSIYHRNRWPL